MREIRDCFMSTIYSEYVHVQIETRVNEREKLALILRFAH